MSEVSESLHLWRATPEDARRLALENDISVRILASNDRWTTLVPLEEDEVETIVAAASGLSLHWQYFDDFGLLLKFYEDGRELGALEWKWQASRAAEESSGLLQRLGGLGVLASTEAIALVGRFAPPGAGAKILRDQVARALGLPAYEWVSPQYCRSLPIEGERERHPEAEDVEMPV